MIDGKTVLAVIPARGGSKGVPRKNVRELRGKPLIAWTIEEAKKSKYIDRLILSSDDPEIISIAESFGCEVPFVRPAELAQDETPGIDPVLHAIDMLPGYDLVVLLQATSPLRIAEDIDGCIASCVENEAMATVSVVQAEQNPYWMYTVGERGQMAPLIPSDKFIGRRQELPDVYILNGAVYVAYKEWLMTHKTFLTDRTTAFVMPKERSPDIDTESDLTLLSMQLN